jgi:hypothetical protein
MRYPYRHGINSLLLNDQRKKFLDAEFVLGVEPPKNLYTPWFEIDCSDPQERQAQEKLNSKVCRRKRQIDRYGAALWPIIGPIRYG